MFLRREDSDGISAGRFVNPGYPGYLYRNRTARLQGGKFVNPRVLPPVRTAQIQIDYDNAYHFGAKVGSPNRRRDD